MFSLTQIVLLFPYSLTINVLWFKQKPNPSNLLCHLMHTSVKSPIIHDPCVQHISHQLDPLCWNPPLWLPLFLALHISFIFSQALFYSAFCFKAASLIILTPPCELCMMVLTQAGSLGIWKMICINDGWWWRGDDEKGENGMRQKERRSCQEKCGWWAPDHDSNEAHPTFKPIINCLCPSGWFLHGWAPSPQLQS